MKFLIPGIIILFCAPAVFVPASKVRLIMYVALASLVLGGFGCLWPSIMPVNFLTDHPGAADSPLHPTLSVFYGGILLLFSLGLCLALGCRSMLLYFRILKIS
jgi:hypothetical protein